MIAWLINPPSSGTLAFSLRPVPSLPAADSPAFHTVSSASPLTLSSLGSVGSSTLVDTHNTIERSFLDVMRSQCHGLTSLHTDHHARSTCA